MANKVFYFVGVTTGGSSVNQLFPKWMQVLGRPDVGLKGIDHPLDDDPENYRRTVERIKNEPDCVGALVTTHKLNVVKAASDLFDWFDPLAELTHEVSCIAKRDGKLLGFAKDPISSGKALRIILGDDYFQRTGGEVLCLGAGGAAVATLLHLMLHDDQPSRFMAVDIDQSRLEHAQQIAQNQQHNIDLVFKRTGSAAENDILLAQMPAGSVVINATGMGKDRPGSPLTEQAVYPHKSVVWEFNYRGPRLFYHDAMARAEDRELTVFDGWDYFVIGWLEVLTEVLQVDFSADIYERIKAVSI
ncbi:MAG: shikimate dehydrogenase [Chloroflexota bacterium]